MSHAINREECLNGIRSTVISPGETVTDILKSRKTNPITQEEMANLLQPEDCARHDPLRCVPATACLSGRSGAIADVE